MADPDLTCQKCEGVGRYEGEFLRLDGTRGTTYNCRGCAGTGRRRPWLHEFDAVVAERDRLREGLYKIADLADDLRVP